MIPPPNPEAIRKGEAQLVAWYVRHGVTPVHRIPAGWFSNPAAIAVLSAMERLESAGESVAIPTLQIEFSRDPSALPCPAEDLTLILTDTDATEMPRCAAESLAREIGEAFARRDFERILTNAMVNLHAGSDPAEIVREISLSRAGKASHHGPPFREMLAQAAIRGTAFLEMEIPERPCLVGDWFREGDLGFIFAPRGVGKTWLAHLLVSSLTAGRDLGDWAVPHPVPVCLLDGEMPPGDVQDRLRRLNVAGENFTILSHQWLYEIAGRSFQLADSEQRAALLSFCISEGIKALVIDNLSSVSHISENDNDEWPVIGDWLLEFRRHGIAVIVVHHAGRNGQMRGASRREDPAFWIVRLDDSRDRHGTTQGARFVTTFTKNRNARQWPTPTDWRIDTDETGNFAVAHEPADNSALVLQSIRDGLETCGDIAEELGLSKGTISKIAARLESNGQIRIEGRKYAAN